MSFLLFLRGLVGALLAFAIMTYVATGSLWTTFVQTVICAVLIQIGYFGAVIFRMWRGVGQEAEASKNGTAKSFAEKETVSTKSEPIALARLLRHQRRVSRSGSS
jgi:exopolysaccharide production repressor protein